VPAVAQLLGAKCRDQTNRFLTRVENLVMGTRFEELHTGIDGPGASGDGVSEAGAGAALPRRAISRRAAALGAAGPTAPAAGTTAPLPRHPPNHLGGPPR